MAHQASHPVNGETENSNGAIKYPHRLHSNLIVRQHQSLCDLIHIDASSIQIDGKRLEVADVISVARYGTNITIMVGAQDALIDSCNALERRLAGGEIIYGVNTGFGGTADVRTNETQKLQRMLIRELNYGILPEAKQKSHEYSNGAVDKHRHFDLDQEDHSESKYLPYTWVRATILIRINSLIKGYSGVRPVIVERLIDLLERDIIPMIPLRGSISASGDLSPLSYIGGAIQGKPSIRIFSKSRGYITAEQAFAENDLDPISLQAKEGLAVVNGTAVSCASAAIAVHDAHGLAVLSQILTAMTVESLTGTAESFHPFFAETRPHPGQIESASNILRFLSGSKLTKVNTGSEASLRQDRYSIRTAPQWLGPVLEDLVQAHDQISTECNSATDNPLVSPEGEFLHGGNFQAKVVTSAMEKTRQGLHSIGRMLYVQCSEIINPATSRGLPPNLVAEDPSASCIFKGADIYTASLLSELGFLANPVNHVQNAEMGNQALNSLALISARYTHTAIDVLSQMAAQHLVALCQALDLRVMHLKFCESYRPELKQLVFNKFGGIANLDDLEERLWHKLSKSFDMTVSMDAKDRFHAIAKSLYEVLFEHDGLIAAENFQQAIVDFIGELANSLRVQWCAHRDAYLMADGSGDASPFLGMASKRMYNFVRKDLRVLMLHTKWLETPDPEARNGKGDESPETMTVGSYTGIVYRAIRTGALTKVAVEILGDK